MGRGSGLHERSALNYRQQMEVAACRRRETWPRLRAGCRWCGGTGAYDTVGMKHTVRCSKCRACGDFANTPAKAAEAWEKLVSL